jgi:nucleoid DNA-binding protein
MSKIVKRQDLVDLLAKKTNFYKYNMKTVVAALEEIIYETLQDATFEQDSEIHLAPGLVILGHREPEKEAKDPRTGEKIISPEKVIPRANFRPTLRLALYKKPKGYIKKGKKKKV